MIDCHEVYLSTQPQEECDFIHEKDVACKEDFLVQIYQYCRDLILVPGHYTRLFPSGLAFKSCNFLAQYLPCDFNILDYHWAVLYLVAANHY